MKKSGERMTPEFYRNELIYGEHVLRYRACLPAVKGRNVLDVSSGSGYGTKLLADEAKSVTGVDIASEAVEYAKQHFAAKNIKFLVGDAHKLPLKDGAVDVAVSFETIEHLKHPKKFISEVKRVLMKGGLLIVSTPNKAEYPSGNEFHLHEFDKKEFTALLKQHFAHVVLIPQHNWFATSLGAPKGEVEAHFETTAPVEKADYFVAVCSDVKPPKLSGELIIAQRFDAKSQQQENDRRLKQLQDYESRIQESESRLTEYEQQVARLKESLNRFTQNPAIKFAKTLRDATRRGRR